MSKSFALFTRATVFLISVYILLTVQTIASRSAEQYEIEAAVNDEHFIINGEKFEAQTYCLGWEEGDMVIFIDGSALGACATATLFNVGRREKCNVWCE